MQGKSVTLSGLSGSSRRLRCGRVGHVPASIVMIWYVSTLSGRQDGAWRIITYLLVLRLETRTKQNLPLYVWEA